MAHSTSALLHAKNTIAVLISKLVSPQFSSIRYGSEDGLCKSDDCVETPGSGNGQGSQSGTGVAVGTFTTFPVSIFSVRLNTPI